MKVSELIAELELKKILYGDLPVYICSYSGTSQIGEVEHCKAEAERKKRFANDEIMPEMILIQG